MIPSLRMVRSLGFIMTCAVAGNALAFDAEGTAFYESKIRPILIEHCYDCHSEAEQEQKGGLLLDRESGWLEGGDSGKAVVPGNLEGSLLIAAVQRLDEDDAMPPKYALDESSVKLLEAWVNRGAPGSAQDMGATSFSQLGDQTVIFENAKTHWAFQPLSETPPPVTSEHPVDGFVSAALAENGMRFSPAADQHTLVKRLAYDLTGLPPTEEMFEKSPTALIDELIASPQFGEHFARMWLDVARYADTANTYRPDTRTPHYYPYAFTYRDWVIDSFNNDKPFADFVREQLAADLLELPENAPQLAGLGFLGVSPIRVVNPDFIDDAIDATTRGFLGLTVACARCHDHKFEPVPTADYYSLYGVFGSVTRPAVSSFNSYPQIAGYRPSEEEKADFKKKHAAIIAEIDKVGKDKKKNNGRSKATEIRETKEARLLLSHDGAPARAMMVFESKKPVSPIIFVRGDKANRGERVTRNFLKILDPEQTPYPADASGRLELANQIIDPKNPLTARVFVNRVWGAILGNYLVDTPSDFGLEGSKPTHPELLDWLAGDFIKNGGSIKHLVRTIVSSQTYQQNSRTRKDFAAKDPENRLYWRANSKRLQIEQLRDSLLAISGELDPKMRGRSGVLWDEANYTHRRSVYGYINRFNLDPTLRTFDFPSPAQTQDRRTESVVAPQALFSMNAPFVVDQANALLERLNFQAGLGREDRINSIFQEVLHRDAEEAEITRIGRFADIEEGRKVNPWPLIAQALFMSNEFLYVE